MKYIATCAPTFFGYIISVLASVILNPRISQFFFFAQYAMEIQTFYSVFNSLWSPLIIGENENFYLLHDQDQKTATKIII